MAGNQCREARCRVGLEPLFVGLLVVLVRHPLAGSTVVNNRMKLEAAIWFRANVGPLLRMSDGQGGAKLARAKASTRSQNQNPRQLGWGSLKVWPRFEEVVPCAEPRHGRGPEGGVPLNSGVGALGGKGNARCSRLQRTNHTAVPKQTRGMHTDGAAARNASHENAL